MSTLATATGSESAQIGPVVVSALCIRAEWVDVGEAVGSQGVVDRHGVFCCPSGEGEGNKGEWISGRGSV
jgi:hypothetical protein